MWRAFHAAKLTFGMSFAAGVYAPPQDLTAYSSQGSSTTV